MMIPGVPSHSLIYSFVIQILQSFTVLLGIWVSLFVSLCIIICINSSLWLRIGVSGGALVAMLIVAVVDRYETVAKPQEVSEALQHCRNAGSRSGYLISALSTCSLAEMFARTSSSKSMKNLLSSSINAYHQRSAWNVTSYGREEV